ncbi:unnamed protein product [Ilex paraguariensis]|uniref:NHL repeat-containing protein n=1 Tax=Ilex paraguariensis TaxID=185542 RepID=A0ABC8UNI5_9AQUA
MRASLFFLTCLTLLVAYVHQFQAHAAPADSRARLVAGSFQGYTGHVDGKPSDARFNHPKGVTMDDEGNVYVADTSNISFGLHSFAYLPLLLELGRVYFEKVIIGF